MNADIGRIESQEIMRARQDALDGYDPDRRVDVNHEVPHETDVYDPDKRLDVLYTTREERIRWAVYTDGTWSDTPGDSRIRPNDESITGKAARDKLREFGLEDIEYKDGVVNFADCSVESVQIDDMTSDIEGNRSQALRIVADRWNENGNVQENGEEWTPNAVRDWASKNRLEFHECSDMRTCQFVPREIHRYFKHTGGRLECRIREGQQSGGVFDA